MLKTTNKEKKGSGMELGNPGVRKGNGNVIATWLAAAATLMTLGMAFVGAEISTFYQMGDPQKGRIMPVHPADDRRRIWPVHDVITPHVPLAPKITGGPVRVLAIANQNYGRWPLELKQRLDIDLSVVYTRSNTQFGYDPGSIGLLAEDVEARLVQMLNKSPQVIVSEFNFERFPKKAKERIQALMDSGVAYVGYLNGVDLTGFSPRVDAQQDIFASSVPFACLRELARAFETREKAAEQAFELYENENGHRLASVWEYPRDDAAPDPSWLMYEWNPRFEEEAWNSLLARVILWCAGHDDAGLTVKMPRQAVSRRDFPLSIEARVEDPANATIIECLVFDGAGRERHRVEAAISAAEVELELPVLPAGDYFVLAHLYVDGAVRDWSLRALRIVSDIEVAKIDIDDSLIAQNEEVTASIMLSGVPDAGLVLTVETLDNFGRVLHRRSMPAAEEVKVTLPTGGSLHIHNYVNVQLKSADGDLIHETRHAFAISQPSLPADDLVTRMWGANASGRHWHRPWKHVRDGLDVTRGGPDEAAYYNMRAEVGAADARGIRIVSPTESDAGGREVSTRKTRETAEKWAEFPIFQYHLGDDFKFNEEWNPYALDYLGGWAKNRYGTVDRLNEAWSTEYDDFSEVTPVEQSQAEAHAYSSDDSDYGGLCHWVDQQLAREDMLVAFVGELKEAIREVDPRTPLALNNTIRYPSPNTGFNYWKLAKAFDTVGAYANPITHDVYRCARATGSRHGIYSGSYGVYQYPPYYAMQYAPWEAVFNNMNVHAYWYGLPNYRLYPGILAPDLGHLLGYREVQKNVEELKAGVAKMLFNAERQNDGVAVLYSQGSINASAFLGKTTKDSVIPALPVPEQWTERYLSYSSGDRHVYMNCWEGLTNLIKDIGFNYDVVSDDCLKQGVLNEKGFAMLVLPLALRLDAETVKAIREFVRDGGTVLADFAPGLFNGRMRPAIPGALADVFGFEYAGGLPEMVLDEGVISEDAATVLEAVEGALTDDMSVSGMYLSLANIDIKGATALARTGTQTPLMMIHEYGRGKAILLNTMARDYQLWRTLGREMPFRQAVAATLKWAGMTPRVECRVHAFRAGQRPLQATEKVRFVHGDLEYVGILRDFSLRPDERIILSDMRAHPTRIDFGRRAHVYNVREGIYRGYRQEVDEMIHPAQARLYALLPYEAKWLEGNIKYVPENHLVEMNVAVTTVGEGAAGRHVIRLEVTDAQGRERREYAANLIAEGGRLNHSLYLGLEPELGQWCMSLKDVATGLSLTRNVNVTPGE
ncbi:MAG: beta-galactosidase [Candidatus Pacebacteria bacterium]|nr:beta-galactosidase [Candidatus Paceibacterota bacterium]